MSPVVWLIFTVIDLYIFLLIGNAILSWLIAFNVVNMRNQFVSQVGLFLHKITEPALRPIRNIIPGIGGIDISPVVLILILMFGQRVILEYLA